jgi:predicted small metal-binding protein
VVKVQPAWLASSAASFAADKAPSMKTMTCNQLGGKCDQKLSAETWDAMVKTTTRHVMETPGARSEWKPSTSGIQAWGREMKPEWDAAPEA